MILFDDITPSLLDFAGGLDHEVGGIRKGRCWSDNIGHGGDFLFRGRRSVRPPATLYTSLLRAAGSRNPPALIPERAEPVSVFSKGTMSHNYRLAKINHLLTIIRIATQPGRTA